MLCDKCSEETNGEHIYLGAFGVWCLPCCNYERIVLSPEEQRRAEAIAAQCKAQPAVNHQARADAANAQPSRGDNAGEGRGNTTS
jgi:hypothetical protein